MKTLYLITYSLWVSQQENDYLSIQIEKLEVSKETDKVIFFAPNNMDKIKANKDWLDNIKTITSDIKGLQLKLLTENKDQGIEQLKETAKQWLEDYFLCLTYLLKRAKQDGIETSVVIS